MSGTSNGHPIGVHIGYCPCIHNIWINCSTTSMEKCSFTLHSKSSGNFTTCTYRLLWKKKVLLYMSQDDTTGTVLYLLRGSVKDQTMWVILMRHLLEKRLTYGESQNARTGRGQGFTRDLTSSIPLVRSVVSSWCFLTYSQFLTYFAVDSSSVQWLVIPYCDHWDGIHCCLTVYLPFCYWVWKWTIRYLCNEHKNIKLSPAHGYLCMPKASEQYEQKQPNGHSTLCKIKYYLK